MKKNKNFVKFVLISMILYYALNNFEEEAVDEARYKIKNLEEGQTYNLANN